jgi:hypothetical protein
MDGMITPEQVNFINVLCRRNGVNVMKYVNSGKKKYAAHRRRPLRGRREDGRAPVRVSEQGGPVKIPGGEGVRQVLEERGPAVSEERR